MTEPALRDEATPGGDPESSRWSEKLWLLLLALVAAGASLGGAWFGADVAADATIDSQQLQADEARSREDRDRRAGVYFEFLEKADAYGSDSAEATRCVLTEIGPNPPPGFVIRDCGEQFADVAKSRYKFQGARNRVFVYGSQQAEDAAALLAGTLPEALATASVGGLSGSGIPPIPQRIDESEFSMKYNDFLAVACRDLKVDSSRQCA